MDTSNALEFLKNRDKVLNKIITDVGYFALKRRTDYYAALISSIINQQLSGSAAQAIYERLIEKIYGKFEPKKIIDLGEEKLRCVGISRNKAKAIMELSEKFHNEPSFLSDIEKLSDHEVIEELSKLRGIGEWTCQMFLIFSLKRLDVLPIKDAGFRKAISKFYNDMKAVDDTTIIEISDNWRPFRTIAVWYLWRAIDGGSRSPIQI